MLVVTLIKDELLGCDSINVTFKYSKEYLRRIKTIPTAKFDPETKSWNFNKQHFDEFEEEFEGEIVYKTPEYIIKNQPIPDYKELYTIDDKIKSPILKLIPFNYQDYGIRFMIDRIQRYGFVFNTDSVGLGKTIQAIGTMKYFIENNSFKKILIVAKKSLKQQWKSEINKFTDLKDDFYIEYSKSEKKERNKLYKELDTKEKFILITNYHSVWKDEDILNKYNFDLVIMDEVHYIKARTGEMNKAVTKLAKGKKCIFLTGTPLMSKPDDLFGIIKIANKDYLGKWQDFQKKYITQEYNGKFLNVVGYKNLNELRDKIQKIIIRRTENEVSLQLPEIITKEIIVSKDPVQTKLDNAIKDNKKRLLEEMDALESNKTKYTDFKIKYEKCEGSLKGLVACEQACADDPRLILLSKSFAVKKFYSSFIPSTYKRSPKMETLLELVEEILDAEEKVIIFSKFERCTKLIEKELSALKIKSVLYTGDVNDEQREINIKLFTTTDEYNVLIATDAGSEGWTKSLALTS